MDERTGELQVESAIWDVPFNKACIAGKEYEYISQAIQRGHISGNGYFTKKCEELLKSQLGTHRALLTTSCTHALEMAALLLNIHKGDEVILPSFTFVSTANAFAQRGAKPVFIDIRPDTLNLDESKLEKLITKHTKAIVPVHYAGVACEMDTIMEITSRNGIPVIEDNAHGLYGKYKGRSLGTFGAMATQSFHETKNITCGEGGALLINNPEYVERAEIIREKGTNRSKFFRGEVDKYTWLDKGSSYLASDMLAAFLLAQLENGERIQIKRRDIWEYYYNNLSDWANSNDVRMPIYPESCEQAYHMYYILLPTQEIRQALIEHLKNLKILSVFHYLPLHLSTMGKNYCGKDSDLNVTENVCDRLLRLPMYNDMTQEDQMKVVQSVHEFTF